MARKKSTTDTNAPHEAVLNPAEILVAIRNCGIVGAGGAGFPTHVKYASKAGVVIANGAECEPLLHVDKEAMETMAPEIIGGMALAMTAVGASAGVFGVKRKNIKAIQALEAAIRASGDSRLSLHLMENYYPAGDEHNLVNEVTGRVIPELGLPLALGAVVSNVTTLAQVYHAVTKGAPVTRRLVTIAGAVADPLTVMVPVGTSFTDLITFAGGPACKTFKVVSGGPMMGEVVDHTVAVVTKTTSGILVFPEDHYVIRKKTMPIDRVIRNSRTLCCQCRYCTDLCPRYLLGHRMEPHMIMRSVNYSNADSWVKLLGAQLCSECGVCSMYACFMDLSPQMMNRAIKREFGARGVRGGLDQAPENTRAFMEARKVPVSRLVNKIDVARFMGNHRFAGEFSVAGTVSIPLRQHIGLPAIPVVKPGDRVEEGSLLGEIPEGKMGARVHSSVRGTIEQVNPDRVVLKVV